MTNEYPRIYGAALLDGRVVMVCAPCAGEYVDVVGAVRLNGDGPGVNWLCGLCGKVQRMA